MKLSEFPSEPLWLIPPSRGFLRFSAAQTVLYRDRIPSDVSAALRRAVAEVIVRDAYVRVWREEIELNPISLGTNLSPRASAFQDYLSAKKLKAQAFLFPTDAPLAALVLRIVPEENQLQWPKGGSILVPAGGKNSLSANGHRQLLSVVFTVMTFVLVICYGGFASVARARIERTQRHSTG